MAAQLPKLDYLRAAVNSVVHFQKEYWLYADPVASVEKWARFRDMVEKILQGLEESEYWKGAELVRQADEYILSEGKSHFRAEDFRQLDRAQVDRRRWWWYLDEVIEGKLVPEPGPAFGRGENLEF